LLEQAIELADLTSIQRVGGIVEYLALFLDARLHWRNACSNDHEGNRRENSSESC
jgi:hypothetical protein